MMLRLILTVCERWRYPLLTPKQPDVIIDPSWPLEKRIWWALEAISDHCDGAKRLDGVGYSKYDRPVADRLQGLELAKWTDKDIDDGLHLIRKYRGQLERMRVKMEDVIGDMGMVVTIDNDNDSDTVVNNGAPKQPEPVKTQVNRGDDSSVGRAPLTQEAVGSTPTHSSAETLSAPIPIKR